MSKICASCKVPKEASLFYKDRQKKDGLMSYCKECSGVFNRKGYLNRSSPEKRYQSRKGLTQTEYAKLWRQENPELVKQYRNTWAKSNVAKLREKNMRRYVAQTQQTPKWLNAAHKAEIEGLYMFCQLFKGFEVDHIVPVRGKTVSGMHVPWNLQVLTCKQNRAKSNLLLPMECK